MVALAEAPYRGSSATSRLGMTRARVLDQAGEAWLLSAAALDMPLHEVELEQECRSREVQRLRLQAHVQARGLGDVGAMLVLHGEQGDEDLRHKEVHPRQLVTLFGPLTVTRQAYRGRRGPSVHPLDSALALPERSFSYEVQRRLIKAIVQGPYDEGVKSVRDWIGGGPCKRTAQRLVVEAAWDVDPFYSQRSPPPGRETGAVLVGSADGKGIPIRSSEPVPRDVRPQRGPKRDRKRMATVGVVYTRAAWRRTAEEVVASLFRESPKPLDGTPSRGPPLEDKRVYASLLRPREEVVTEIAEEMGRRDPDRQKTWVCMCDGDHVLQRLIEERIPQAQLVLDFIHAVEYLWKAVYVFHKPTSDQAVEWVKLRALWMLQGRSGQIVKGLRQSITKRRLKGQKKKILESVARYFQRNRDRMRYDICLEQGLPIATGAVEGACKTIIHDRMERSGMRWSREGADALVKLRATYLSHDFDEYWRFHIQQEQRRLHPPGAWTAFASSA